MTESNDQLSFWEHLDELRGRIVRILLAVLVFGVAAFCLKDWVFAVVLAPKSSNFLTYRLLARLGVAIPDFSIDLINTELAQQFLIHVKLSLCTGALAVSPYIIYSIFGFVSPALYTSERRIALKAVGGGYLMFIVGAATAYFIIFPLTFHFLGTYQVSDSIANYITLASYTSTLLTLCLLMGIMFELPVLCWILARLGLITSLFLKQFRRHAIVVICILAAIITPTADAFTLCVVAVPIYLLYELGIGIVRRTERGK